MDSGLTEIEVKEQQKQFGPNIILEKNKFSKWDLFVGQFKSPLIYIILIVAAISLILREWQDAILASVVIIANVIMGFYQEHSAQKTLLALQRLINPQTMVIRDGKRQIIPVSEVVPGDTIILSPGDKIPADGKLIEAFNLLVNEAVLTGESEAVGKNIEEQNELYMGTAVIAGKGIMQVVTIGYQTKIGQIGQTLAKIEETATPLQVKLTKFSQTLVWVILAICVLIFVFGVFYEENVWLMLRMAIILAIAAIPEGLPIAITVILAIGMRRILKRHGLVKKLLAIETLGSTTVICTDKTGTLTEGKMEVVKTDATDLKKLLLATVLTNEQKTGLEVALWQYAEKNDLDTQKTIQDFPQIKEIPFSSETKFALTLNKVDDKDITFALGAPEIILSFCDATQKQEIQQKINAWAEDGLRLLAAAYKDGDALDNQSGFVWLGLIGIRDPIRPEVKNAIDLAQDAGIKIKIVTGDFRRTAEIVATNVGLKFGPENVISGEELENISDDDLTKRIQDLVIFYRVSPHQKLKIVKCLQSQGEVVAMTGDGVNDAPALKQSDIGVVVESATDVAKEAGDLILMDNNFQTIVAACEEGRTIFINIKKVVAYVLSNSFAEIVLIFGAILMNLPVPLTIVQILYIHLICDGPPDIVLGFEPTEKDIMKKNPREMVREKILSRQILFLIIGISSFIGLIALYFFNHFYRQNLEIDYIRTNIFAVVATVDLIYIFSFKNLDKTIFQMENFWKNYALLLSVIYGFTLLLLAIYWAPLQNLLHTKPLHLIDWLEVIGIGIFITLIVEIAKVVRFWLKTKK